MFAILFEVLLIEIQEEIHHFPGWGGGFNVRKNCEQKFCEQTGVSKVVVSFSGQLTYTNKRVQADEHKIARNEGFLAPPTFHLLCTCSLLLTSEFSHLRKRSAEKLHFCAFPGICSISESAKKLQKLFGSALSHLIKCYCWDFGPGVCSGSPQDAENGLPVVHICWCTLAALLFMAVVVSWAV